MFAVRASQETRGIHTHGEGVDPKGNPMAAINIRRLSLRNAQGSLHRRLSKRAPPVRLDRESPGAARAVLAESTWRDPAMKTFMAVYTGTPDAFEKYQKQFPDPVKRAANEKAGMDAWMKWGVTHAKSVVDHGGPLGRTKRVTKDGIADIRNHLAGYTVVRAESQEAAATMFLDHPHFTIFPGDAVEIMEVLPIPEMP